jgi:response regulator RpfG family c-di-GMP phosphodiesterase
MLDELTALDADDVAPTPGACLLMVDDEPSVLSALRRLFRTQGYKVIQATSGVDALTLLSSESVDLVISDMRMPEMDGAQLLEKVREHDPNIGRILLTGYADINSTVAAINRGEIHRYIAKPWDDQDLLLVVSEALTRRDLEAQNRQLLKLTQQQNEELAQLNRTLEDRVQARVAEIEQINGMLDTAYDELNQTFMVAVNVFSGLMEMRQDGIAGHSRRVADLSRAVALQLKLDENAQNEIYLAGLLHDIGKLGFPDSMLGKPSSTYTPEELVRYRTHPHDGEVALMPLAKLQSVAHMVGQHHERFDGNGFPAGLVGDQIMVGARIVAAASDYDGLVHGGMAQQQYLPEPALELIRQSIGTHYDKQVVAALVAAVRAMAEPDPNDYVVDAFELKAGMRLACDLLSPKGSLLLPKGLVFNAKVIAQVQRFVTTSKVGLELHILKDRLAPPRSPAATAATAAAPAAQPAAQAA